MALFEFPIFLRLGISACTPGITSIQGTVKQGAFLSPQVIHASKTLAHGETEAGACGQAISLACGLVRLKEVPSTAVARSRWLKATVPRFPREGLGVSSRRVPSMCLGFGLSFYADLAIKLSMCVHASLYKTCIVLAQVCNRTPQECYMRLYLYLSSWHLRMYTQVDKDGSYSGWLFWWYYCYYVLLLRRRRRRRLLLLLVIITTTSTTSTTSTTTTTAAAATTTTFTTVLVVAAVLLCFGSLPGASKLLDWSVRWRMQRRSAELGPQHDNTIRQNARLLLGRSVAPKPWALEFFLCLAVSLHMLQSLSLDPPEVQISASASSTPGAFLPAI